MKPINRRTSLGKLLTLLILSGPFTGGTQAANILWSSPGTSDWLTATNWTGSAVPTATDNAQLGANPTGSGGVGINFHNTTNAGTQTDGSRIEDVGAIELTSARTSGSPVIGNSSTTVGAGGTLRLNGTTVNSIPNVVLRNNSSQNMTLQNTQGTGTQTMAVALANTTNNIVVIDGTGNITISSAISGSGRKLSLQGAGTGDLVLSGANSFTGGIDVSGLGRLRFNGASSLPSTGDLSVSQGGRIRFATAATYGTTGQTINFNPNQTANAALDLQTNNIAVTLASNINLGADTRIESNGATGSLTLSGNLSGSGALIKQAAGNLVLSGSGNTATGGIQIGNGSVTVGSGSSLGTGPVLLFQTSTNNTALTLNNAAQSVGNLSSQFTAVTGTQTQVITLNGTALTVNQTVDGTYGNGAVNTLTSTLAGTGSLIKSGSATLTLGSANPYSGTTTVSAGTLAVNGSISNSATTVKSGATLTGSGTLGEVMVEVGGIIAPGNGRGTISTGNLSLDGTLAAEISGTGAGMSDQMNVSGTVNLSGTLTLSLAGFTPTADSLFFLINNDGIDAINGTLAGLEQGAQFNMAGQWWQISYNANSTDNAFSGGNDLALQSITIPEPGTALLSGLGLLALLRRRRA